MDFTWIGDFISFMFLFVAWLCGSTFILMKRYK
nr:MAG TPA: hypothetical protein [Caudoviricetes sp.]